MSDAVEVACAVGVKVRWWSAFVELVSVATLTDVEANSKPVNVPFTARFWTVMVCELGL